MENRKKLHDAGIALIIVGIYNLFMLIAGVVESIVDGSVAKELAGVETNILGAVKVTLLVVGVITVLLVAADILLGVKALKVSKKPDASKGYITIAFVFLVLTSISIISNAIAVFSGNASNVDTGLSSTLSVCIYCFFIKAAEDVRKDVLNGEK